MKPTWPLHVAAAGLLLIVVGCSPVTPARPQPSTAPAMAPTEPTHRVPVPDKG